MAACLASTAQFAFFFLRCATCACRESVPFPCRPPVSDHDDRAEHVYASGEWRTSVCGRPDQGSRAQNYCRPAGTCAQVSVRLHGSGAKALFGDDELTPNWPTNFHLPRTGNSVLHAVRGPLHVSAHAMAFCWGANPRGSAPSSARNPTFRPKFIHPFANRCTAETAIADLLSNYVVSTNAITSSRSRGPSSSTRMTRCQVPNNSKPRSTISASEVPISVERMWSGVCSGL